MSVPEGCLGTFPLPSGQTLRAFLLPGVARARVLAIQFDRSPVSVEDLREYQERIRPEVVTRASIVLGRRPGLSATGGLTGRDGRLKPPGVAQDRGRRYEREGGG